MRFLAIFIVFLVSFQGVAVAEDAPSLLLEGGLKSLIVNKYVFTIKVSDRVTDGCLPNPDKLKDKMEISLRKNGFGIANDPDMFTNDILITALGFSTGGSSCAVYVSAKLVFTTLINVPFSDDVTEGNKTLVPYIYQFGSVILSGERYTMQSRLTKQVEEFADTLYLDISRARDDIYSKFPSIEVNIKEKIKEISTNENNE